MSDGPPSALVATLRLAPFGCLGLGGILLVSGVVTFIGLRSVRGWPVVEGRVVQARVATHDETHRPEVTYSYEVDGVRYEGVRFGLNTQDGGADPWAGNTDREKALEWVRRHQPGTPVRVHVDPRRPSNAVLDTSTDASAAWVKWIVAVFFIAVGLAWWKLARSEGV